MIDIQHTEDGDIDITSGDILYSESTSQHQKIYCLPIRGIIRKALKRV